MFVTFEGTLLPQNTKYCVKNTIFINTLYAGCIVYEAECAVVVEAQVSTQIDCVHTSMNSVCIVKGESPQSIVRCIVM